MYITDDNTQYISCDQANKILEIAGIATRILQGVLHNDIDIKDKEEEIFWINYSLLGFENVIKIRNKRLSRGDKIRSMNNRELAEFLCEFSDNNTDYFEDICSKYCDKEGCDCPACSDEMKDNSACPHAIEWWLGTEAKE